MERDLIRTFFSRANPNPTREGCPEASVLQAIVDNTLPVNHPARLHLASCSPCFIQFRSLKVHAEKAKRKQAPPVLVIAASFLVAIGAVFGLAVYQRNRPPMIEEASVTRTLDLWERGATRGMEEIHNGSEMNLPQRIVKLQVVLPRLSESGHYVIGIAQNRMAQNLVQATGASVARGAKKTVTVTLDLRSTKPGLYFLTTTREQEAASYYYPIKLS